MTRAAIIASLLLVASPAVAESLEELAALAERYPQDPGLALRCAWAAAEAGEHASAVDWYHRALAANADHYEARLGLAWARWHLGEDTAAAFQALVDERPSDRRALDGLEASRYGRRGAQAGLAAAGTLYPGDPGRSHGEGLAVGVSSWNGSLVGGASYRGTRLVLTEMSDSEPTPGQPPGMGVQSAAAQHEAWAWAGLARARWGATLHAAGILDGTEDDSSAFVLGAVARLGAASGANLRGEYSLSLYEDQEIHRGSASWNQPLGSIPVTLSPLAGLQLVDDTPHVSAGLELSRDGERVDLRLGAKAGREQRPVLLGSSLVYNLPGTIAGSGWAGASLDLDGSWTPSLTTELLRLQSDDTELPSSSSWVLTTQLGLTHRF